MVIFHSILEFEGLEVSSLFFFFYNTLQRRATSTVAHCKYSLEFNRIRWKQEEDNFVYYTGVVAILISYTRMHTAINNS